MMKRFFVFLVAIIAVSFGSAGFAAKTKAVPVNPLIGKWVVANQGAKVDIEFTADKATFTTYDNASGDPRSFESDYKYGKSPLVLKYKSGEKNKTITMKYKIVGKKLTYRFTKGADGIETSVYLKRLPNGKTSITDIVAVKSEVKAEKKAEGEVK